MRNREKETPLHALIFAGKNDDDDDICFLSLRPLCYAVVGQLCAPETNCFLSLRPLCFATVGQLSAQKTKITIRAKAKQFMSQL